MTVLARADYRALLRGDFHSFLLRSFYELYGGRRFRPPGMSRRWRRSSRAQGAGGRCGSWSTSRRGT